MGRPMKFRELPPVERLTLLLEADFENGTLRWKMRGPETFEAVGTRSPDWASAHWNSKNGGKIAGSQREHGYHMTMVDGVHFMSHRLIWKMAYGTDPVEIDHIDHDRVNNRLENLREVTHLVNSRNLSLYKSNKSGVPGVSYHNRDGVWQARIGIQMQEVQLGNFKTKDEAIAARMAAQIVLDFHPNHGNVATPKGT